MGLWWGVECGEGVSDSDIGCVSGLWFAGVFSISIMWSCSGVCCVLVWLGVQSDWRSDGGSGVDESSKFGLGCCVA